MMMDWLSNYIGLPFKTGGRDRSGIDCWGLVRLVMAERMSVDLPSYDGTDNIADTIKAAKRSMDWHMITGPKAFDVLVMLTPVSGMRFFPLHVGVMVGPRTVLHIDEGRVSESLDVANPAIRTRIDGYYRHHLLMDA